MRWALFSLAAVLIFTVFTTVYAASAPAKSVRVLPKIIWVLLCLFVPLFGGLLYLLVGRPADGGSQSGSRRAPVAPDDDPDFLRNLEKRLRDEGSADGSEKP